MKKLAILLLLASISYSCKTESKREKKVEKPAQSDWIVLFDGSSLEGWRAYNGSELPPGWVIQEGVLTFDTEKRLEADYKGGKDIIYGLEEFDNFELYLEWKLPEGGNSGVFYHLKEGYGSPAEVAPEYQLIDDVNYGRIHDLTAYNTSLGYPNPEELQPLQQTASDYAMYAANPEKKVLHPIGSWNTTKIMFTPNKVEYWLNGEKVLSFVPWSEDWKQRKNVGKWKDFPDYGKFKTGYIGFQDHDSPIGFRNIKIRKL